MKIILLLPNKNNSKMIHKEIIQMMILKEIIQIMIFYEMI